MSIVMVAPVLQICIFLHILGKDKHFGLPVGVLQGGAYTQCRNTARLHPSQRSKPPTFAPVGDATERCTKACGTPF